MEIIKFVYNEKEVDFLPGGNENVMVNATQMAKIFEKDVRIFLKSDHAQAFIEALLMTPYGDNKSDLSATNGKNKFKYSKDEIIKTNKKGGTWMHRILTLKFAAWLDPYFEVWVFHTIDKIILGHLKEIRDATMEKMDAEKARDKMQAELLQKYPDEFSAYLEIEGKLTAAHKKRIAAIKASSSQIKMDF